jgi:signal peptidase I
MPPPRTLALVCLRSLVLALAAVALVRATVLTSYRVCGTSMREALQDGDRILVCEARWMLDPPRAGDTVVALVEDEVLVKRVAAVPGDTIGMRQGVVLRNGRPVREAVPQALDCRDSFPEVALGGDEYFLLGDHRRVSVDSRDFGPVRSGQLAGRVLLRIHGSAVSRVEALERATR